MFDSNNIPNVPKVSGKGILKWGGGAVAAISAVVLISNSYFQVEDGKFAVYQNTLTGAKSVVHGPSASFRVPGFSIDTHYKYSTTIDFDDAAMTQKVLAASTNPAIDVRFADTYVGKIPMSARLEIPRNDEAILKIHGSFRGYDNLVDKLMEKTLKDVAVNTATQYTGEEFFQGALNDFKTAILDQANNGIIKTKRIKVEDETGVTASVDVGADKSKGGTVKKKNMVWRTVPQLDEASKVIRVENPLEQYGVTVTQINIGNPIPEERLNTLLGKKKELVAKKIEITQRQENAKAEAETAKLEGETERIKAEQKQLMAADAEVIARKKEVQLAGLQAEKEKVEKEKEAALAKIEKQKELDIAKANEGIQKANAIAAKYEAQTIKEKGIAEADVLAAKYKALNDNKDIVMAEIQRDMTKSMVSGMKDFKVVMPTYSVNGKNGENNSLQVVMDAMGIKSLDEISKKIK